MSKAIMIITDQQRHDAVGVHKSFLKTPFLDSLYKKSIVCSNTYVQSPQCQPNRISIFTGRYPTSHRVLWNETKFPTNETLFPKLLQQNGVKTAYFGKSHFSPDDRNIIADLGFSESFLYDDWKHISSGCFWDTPKGKMTSAKLEYMQIMKTKSWSGRLNEIALHHDNMIIQNLKNWLKNDYDNYFCVLSFVGPHPPYAAPKPYSEMYSEITFDNPKRSYNLNNEELVDEDWQMIKSQYYGYISWIDDMIGSVINDLDDDVAIIFTSDHGDILGDHGLFSKGVFAYQGNIKVPLYFKIPGVDHTVYDKIIQSIDIAPTILEYYNIKKQYNMQGRNLLPDVCVGSEVNDYTLSMIDRGKQKLRMILEDNIKYWVVDDSEYIFNIAIDENEENNLINDKQLLDHMRYKLLRRLIETQDSLVSN